MNPVEKVSQLIAYNLYLGSLGSLSELRSELIKISNSMDKVYTSMTTHAILLKSLDIQYPNEKIAEKELLRRKLIVDMGPISISMNTIVPIIIQQLSPFMGGVISTVMQDADKQTNIMDKEIKTSECQYSRFSDSAIIWVTVVKLSIQNVCVIIRDIPFMQK
jgi:hypothetical protein